MGMFPSKFDTANFIAIVDEVVFSSIKLRVQLVGAAEPESKRTYSTYRDIKSSKVEK